ncbi:MAG TPA: hypothetical protein PLM79_16410 [Syntrophobacteraceae bacterium]|nr:hypothetical protein [Syntrophobacteraceae bacterium]
MWPLREMRRSKRRSVDWSASLECIHEDLRQSVEVRVVEVCPEGVRLVLKKMQVGPYHLFVGDVPTRLELTIPSPRGPITGEVRGRWYNWDESRGAFCMGAEFVELSAEARTILGEDSSSS